MHNCFYIYILSIVDPFKYALGPGKIEKEKKLGIERGEENADVYIVFETKDGGGVRRGGGAWDAKYKRTNQKPDGAGSNSPPPPPIYMPCFFDSNSFFSSFSFLAKKKQIKKSQ